MSTITLQDELQSKLASLLQDLAKQTINIQEVVKVILENSITLPSELIAQIENFVESHKELGYSNKEDFVIRAIGFRLNWLKSDNERLEIPRAQYETLDEAVQKLGTPFSNAEEFINAQINNVLEKYEEYHKNKR